MKFTITRILLYLCFVTAIYSCTHEKDYVENSNREVMISRKPFKDLLLLPSFNKAYEKMKTEKQKSILAKSAIEDEYNFTIDESKAVNIVEAENKTTFNILIKRDTLSSVPSGFFENLVLVSKDVNGTEEISAFILKYVTPDSIEDFSLDNNEGTLLFGKSIMCIPICSPICITPWSDGSGSSGHGAGGSCIVDHYDCSFTCFGSAGGGGDGGGGDGGGSDGAGDGGDGGGGGGGSTPNPNLPTPTNNNSNNDDNLVVYPVLDAEDNLGPETPCQTLKKHLSTVTGIKLKAILPGLQAKVTERGERGKSLIKSTNGTYTTPDIPAVTGVKIKMKYGGPIFGSIHTHPKDTALPMFSFSDVYSLKLFYEGTNGANLPEAVIYLVCKEAGINKTYALKIDDYNTFYDAIVADITATIDPLDLVGLSVDKQEEKIFDQMDEKTRNFYANNPQNLQKAFLNYFGNFGISLYEVNDIGTNWNKLTLKNPVNTTDPIEKTPCKK